MAISVPGLAIRLPDGRVASYEEMREYGQTLQHFIVEQEAVLAQIEDTQRHNEIIDYLNLLAGGYNEQLCAYKAAEAQRQQEMLVILLRLGG